MNKSTKTFGLLIEYGHDSTGSERVTVRIVSRESGKDHPQGVSAFPWDYPKHLEGCELDGLGLHGFVSTCMSTEPPAFIGYEPEYRDVFAIDQHRAARMAKTLKRVIAQIVKDQSRDPGDALMSLAKALKLSFAVRRVGQPGGSSYTDNRWSFGTIGEGRNWYREEIAKAIDAAVERKAA